MIGPFGLPPALASHEVKALRDDIIRFGSSAGFDLSGGAGRDGYVQWFLDLATPTNREMTVRRAIAEVAAAERGPFTVGTDSMFVRLEARRWVPTLEAVLLLPHLPTSMDVPLEFDPTTVAALSSAAVVEYGRLAQARLRRVAQLLSGDGGQLLVVPTISLLLILLNDTTASDKPLPKAPRDVGLGDLARVIRDMVRVVGRAVKPDLEAPSDPKEWELSGYSLSEVNRRLLPPGIVDTDCPVDGRDTPVRGFFLHSDRWEDAAYLVGRELQGRVVANPDLVTVPMVLDTAVDVFRSTVRPALQQLGLSHGNSSIWGRTRAAVQRGADQAASSRQLPQ